MANEDFLLGMDACIYWSAVTIPATALGSMTELSNVKDVTVNLDRAEADHTTRANAGWKATAATLRESSVDFDMVWKPGDASFEAVRDAYLGASGLIHLVVLDQARETVGAQGPNANFVITKFTKTEPLAEVQQVSVTAKLSQFISWVEVEAGS